MRQFDNIEKTNAREWDEVSTISHTPSIAELEAPVDDNESLLLDLNDLPSLPRSTTQAPSNAPRLTVNPQPIARGGSVRPGGAGLQQFQLSAEYIADQYNFKPQRHAAGTRGRGGSYTQQVHSARNPPNSGGTRGGFNQAPSTQARDQYGHHQAPTPNRSSSAKAPWTSSSLLEIPSTGHKQNIDPDRQGIGYQGCDENTPDSTERPTPGDPKYGTGRPKLRNNSLGKVNAFGEWSEKKGHWPKPEGLVSTRRAADQGIKKQMKNEREKYLQELTEEDRILAYGFYLWPQEDGSVVDVLGTDLAPLRHIRMSQKVYIQCLQADGLTELLKISSESTHSEFHIAEAIKGIRSVIADAKAKAVLATPKYFVVLPTASAMRAFIGPKKVVTRTDIIDGVEIPKNIRCIGTQLLGQKFSENEQRMWIQNTVNQDNFVRDFHSRLSSSLMELAPLKIEMRMRVHFGHVVFRKFPPQFAASQQSIDEFTRMLGHPLLRVEIEKTLPATVALRVPLKIVSLRDRFRPAEGRSLSLEEVIEKHTEIFYVETRRGEHLRVEADIDICYDDDYTPEFQLGSYNVFREDHKNKRVDLSAVDPERQVDYSLQIITDRPIDIPPALIKEFETLVKGSISIKGHRQDLFGLRYPRILPRFNRELQATKLVMRSVLRYAFQNSGYVVEIIVNRTWEGPNTSPEPHIAAGVALFHPQWDLEMGSLENSTEGRKWKRGLGNFFESGFETFLIDVQSIQEFLLVAAKEAEEDATKEEAKRKAAQKEAASRAEDEATLEAERQAAVDAQRQTEANTKRQAEEVSAQSLLDD